MYNFGIKTCSNTNLSLKFDKLPFSLESFRTIIIIVECILVKMTDFWDPFLDSHKYVTSYAAMTVS